MWDITSLKYLIFSLKVSGFFKDPSCFHLGHRAFRLDYRLSNSDDILHKDIVMKSKARGYEVMDMITGLQRGFGGVLLETWIQ